MRGPSDSRRSAGQGEQRRPFGLVEAALRPDDHRRGPGRRAPQGRQRIGHLGILVAEDHQPRRVPTAQQRLETGRSAHLRHGEDPALFGRLDGVGPHALLVDPRHLGAPRDDGLQHAGAHLHRLLDHVVEAGMLERGKEQVERRGRRLRTGDLGRMQHRGRLATFERAAPLAVPPVEGQHRLAVAETQHVGQIMRLVLGQRNRNTGGEIAVEVQTRSGKVVAGQGLRLHGGAAGTVAVRRPGRPCQAGAP